VKIHIQKGQRKKRDGKGGKNTGAGISPNCQRKRCNETDCGKAHDRKRKKIFCSLGGGPLGTGGTRRRGGRPPFTKDRDTLQQKSRPGGQKRADYGKGRKTELLKEPGQRKVYKKKETRKQDGISPHITVL